MRSEGAEGAERATETVRGCRVECGERAERGRAVPWLLERRPAVELDEGNAGAREAQLLGNKQFFIDAATPEIYTLPLHDAMPIFVPISPTGQAMALVAVGAYELVSTAYVSATYAVNAPLTADLAAGANPGLLPQSRQLNTGGVTNANAKANLFNKWADNGEI